MQDHQLSSGVEEASTKAPRIRPPMFTMKLDHPSYCDICGKHRGTHKHDRCSRIRQQRKREEWAAYMAEQAVVHTVKQERRRYAR